MCAFVVKLHALCHHPRRRDSAYALVGAAATAAPGDTYKETKAACEDRAKGMDFGIHLIKKHRWVKDCIAGRYPAR